MIPSGFNTDLILISDLEPTKTYKVSDNKIQGFTDNLKALEQAIYKVLNTEKYEHPIYSFDYGIELESLIGKDPTYVKIELKRRIQECLLKDKRITSVDNFVYQIMGDSLFCEFNVESIYGNLLIERQVNL